MSAAAATRLLTAATTYFFYSQSYMSGLKLTIQQIYIKFVSNLDIHPLKLFNLLEMFKEDSMCEAWINIWNEHLKLDQKSIESSLHSVTSFLLKAKINIKMSWIK